MSDPKVSCLTATHGRYSFLKEAITFFLDQDYPNKEMIILNNHEVPLIVDLPNIKVFNFPGHKTLGECRNTLVDLAFGDLVRTWDDDDIYLPWSIRQGVEGFLLAKEKGLTINAWKPVKSWSYRVDKNKIEPSGNAYEATWLVEAKFAREVKYRKGGGDEHKLLATALQETNSMIRGTVKPSEYSYAYRWGSSLCRISGTLNHPKMTVADRTTRWMRLNDDHGNGEPIKEVVEVNHYYDLFKEKAKEIEENDGR